MQTRVKAFNPQIFLEFLCYSAFAGLMLYLISSGKYLSYVTPRMEPYLYFTAIIMGIWALAVLGRMFRPQHKVRSMHCFVLVIPILLFLLPHGPLSTSDFSDNFIGGNTFANRREQNSNDLSLEDRSPTDTTNLYTQTNVPELPGLDTVNKKITVSNDDFGKWLSEIHMNMEKYEGYTIIMTGFVLKNSEVLEEDEFILAHLIMSCCVADLAPAGLLCKHDDVSDLKNDTWITVEGTFFIGQYEYDGKNYDDPQINVTNITPAEAVEGYVYLY
ncbi:TIGR03943 family protein [Alkalibaculum sp. M08DMB]|uniref:TIGR03943 family protein n=1 Tax=Alkalibaculum sporogenes TaxID=2655001 RepID=A0A6A7KBJ4_9FIRM|nr:TIGR03943 family protein [Alkalibaculum sporogenes]MPW26732.1 TIGR03943 family protein [Alkalibaculum sporogenes]